MAEIKKDKVAEFIRPENYPSRKEDVEQRSGESDFDYQARRARELSDKILGANGEFHFEYIDGMPYIDQNNIHPDFTYEFKRFLSVKTQGEEDYSYLYSLEKQGWRRVPATRHPEAGMPPGSEWIMFGSTILMERPRVITNMVLDKIRRDSDNSRSNQMSQKLNQYEDKYQVGHDHRGKSYNEGMGLNREYGPMDR